MLTLKDARELQPGRMLRCHAVAGLELHASKSGKAWKLYYRNQTGERRRPKIGEFPSLTIEIARDIARELLQRVALGGDPSAERHALQTAPTVADLGARYLEFKRPRLKPRSFEEVERQIRIMIEALGPKRVAVVTTADIDKLLRDIEHRKFFKARKDVLGRSIVDTRTTAPIAANRAREAYRGAFGYAIHTLKWCAENPVAATLKRRERKRKVHIQAEDFLAVFRELRGLIKEYPRQVAALMIILYAGTRVTELLQTRNDELHNDVITRQEHKTDRTGRERVIYLPKQAAAILACMPTSKGPLIFGGIDRYAVFRVWEMARTAAGCPNVQVRDFRRTFASVALSQGIAGLDQIGELFGHGDTKTTAGYSWLMDDAARGVAQRTANQLDQLAAPEKEADE